MSLEQNKEVARRALLDVWTKGDMEAADELFAPDFVSHQHSHPDGPRSLGGGDELKAFVREFREAFADFHDTVDDQVAEGDRVATRFTSEGTQAGVFMGVPATNRRVSWMGLVIDRVENGRIIENWVSWDLMGVMQQLGAVAGPASDAGS